MNHFDFSKVLPRFQFSLKALVASVLVVAVGLGWIALKLDEKNRERRVIEAIRTLGGNVIYAHQHTRAYGTTNTWKGAGTEKIDELPTKQGVSLGRDATFLLRGPTFTSEPPGPKWLQTWFGEDLFARVDWVSFGKGQPATSDVLHYVLQLPDIRKLELCYAQIDDDDLLRLQSLEKLEALNVSGTQITDAGLVHLEKLHRLRFLGLNRTAVTDAGMAHLRDMRQLKEIYLDGTAVTKDGLKQLKGMKQLRTLSIRGTTATFLDSGGIEQALPNTVICR